MRLVVDAAGAVEGAFDHDAWGVPDTSVTLPGAELRAHSFQGALGVRNETASTGLYYARHRYYSPELGRWLSADPIGFAGGLNLYTGMANSPTNFVDPDGLDVEVYVTHNNRITGGHVFMRIFGKGYDVTADRNVARTSKGDCDDNMHSLGELFGMTQPGKINFPQVSPENLALMKPENVAHRYKTTAAQDRNLMRLILDEQMNPAPFNMFDSSCTTFVRDILKRSGIDTTNGFAMSTRQGMAPGLSPYDIDGAMYEKVVPPDPRREQINRNMNAPDRNY